MACGISGSVTQSEIRSVSDEEDEICGGSVYGNGDGVGSDATQAASKIKKRTVIERINDSMEKSRRVRENKKKARQLKKQEAERKQPHAPTRSQP